MITINGEPNISKKYLNHEIFKQLDEIKVLYEMLSDSVFGFARQGTGGVANFDSYIFSSIEKSIASVKILFKEGHIADGYAIIRKIFELSVTDLFISLKLADFDKSLRETKDVEMAKKFKVGEVDVKKWLSNDGNKLIGYEKMHLHIREHNLTKSMSKQLSDELDFSNLRTRLNDYFHHNGMKFVSINDFEVYEPNRIERLQQAQKDLSSIISMHLLIYFHINPQFMMSSDYIDHLEIGLTPPEGSQYWINQYLENYLDTFVKPSFPKSLELFISESGMKFAADKYSPKP